MNIVPMNRRPMVAGRPSALLHGIVALVPLGLLSMALTITFAFTMMCLLELYLPSGAMRADALASSAPFQPTDLRLAGGILLSWLAWTLGIRWFAMRSDLVRR